MPPLRMYTLALTQYELSYQLNVLRKGGWGLILQQQSYSRQFECRTNDWLREEEHRQWRSFDYRWWQSMSYSQITSSENLLIRDPRVGCVKGAVLVSNPPEILTQLLFSLQRVTIQQFLCLSCAGLCSLRLISAWKSHSAYRRTSFPRPTTCARGWHTRECFF